MKINILSLVFVLFVSQNTFSQSWTYSSGGNAFDGKYRTSSITGTGTNYPYNKPLFVVNYFENSKSLNIYIADVGYAGCDNKIVKIKFNNNDTIYAFDASTDENKEIWFLSQYSYNYNYTNLTFDQLLKKLMRYSKMYIRITSDCGQNDLEFSLNGSTKAIKFVLPKNYFEIQKRKKIEETKREREEKKKKQEKIFEQKQVDKLLKNGDTYVQYGKYDSALYSYKLAKEIMPNNQEIDNKIKRINKLKEPNNYLVKTGTNLYPNPDGSGDPIIHISSNTVVKILDKIKEEKDYIYVSYKGHKGYMLKIALKY